MSPDEQPVVWPWDERRPVCSGQARATADVIDGAGRLREELAEDGETRLPPLSELAGMAAQQVEACRGLAQKLQEARAGGDLSWCDETRQAWARLGAVAVAALMREQGERRPLGDVELGTSWSALESFSVRDERGSK